MDFSKCFFIFYGDSVIYICDVLVIFIGVFVCYLGLDLEEVFKGKGVSVCVICDGFFYCNQKVVVIGGGNMVVEEVLYFVNIVKEVVVVYCREIFCLEKILQDCLMECVNNGNVILELNYVLDEVLGDDMGVMGMWIKSVGSGEIKDIDLQGVFIVIGYMFNIGIFEGQFDMVNGYIRINSGIEGNVMVISVEGVFVVGDVIDYVYCQVIILVGFGCMVVLDVEKFLDENN